VGSKPGKSEVDVPLTYADYYFIEALVRMDKLVRKNSSGRTD
jgi:unsaturated chondroitin disaccharide hydrolase